MEQLARNNFKILLSRQNKAHRRQFNSEEDFSFASFLLFSFIKDYHFLAFHSCCNFILATVTISVSYWNQFLNRLVSPATCRRWKITAQQKRIWSSLSDRTEDVHGFLAKEHEFTAYRWGEVAKQDYCERILLTMITNIRKEKEKKNTRDKCVVVLHYLQANMNELIRTSFSERHYASTLCRSMDTRSVFIETIPRAPKYSEWKWLYTRVYK